MESEECPGGEAEAAHTCRCPDGGHRTGSREKSRRGWLKACLLIEYGPPRLLQDGGMEAGRVL